VSRTAGTETLDGEDTDHYRLVIDLEAAAQEADMTTSARQRSAPSTRPVCRSCRWRCGSTRTIIIRRIAYVLDLEDVELREQDDAGEVDVDPQFRTTVTIDHTGIGEEVDVEIPDPDNLIVLDEEEIRDAVRGCDPEQSGANGNGTTTTTTTP
jgi:hypothetical protein